jgi:hypothetical protein
MRVLHAAAGGKVRKSRGTVFSGAFVARADDIRPYKDFRVHGQKASRLWFSKERIFQPHLSL